MRANEHRTSAARRALTWLVPAIGLLLMGCGDDESGNLLGTAEQATFEAACDAELEAVKAQNGWQDAEIVEIEREREGGHDVWGVSLDNGVEIEFATDEGCRLLEIEHGEDDDGDDDDDDEEGDD